LEQILQHSFVNFGPCVWHGLLLLLRSDVGISAASGCIRNPPVATELALKFVVSFVLSWW